MSSKRLSLALDRLQPSDWERFEHLASAFLASEFSTLRTVASPNGDDGRDAELFSPDGEPRIVIQYSVTDNWRSKIRATAIRIKEKIPSALMLIYSSNQIIGANADAIKIELRKDYGISLDVRDKNWFVERVFSSDSNQKVAEELSVAIVDPLLAKSGVGPHVQSELSSPEAIAAVTYLGLQWQDEVREKGLTKLAFEALIRAALINTDSSHRMHCSDIHSHIMALLPDHPKDRIRQLIDGALGRLSKHKIKFWQKENEYCLSHEELLRINQFRVESALAENNILSAVREISSRYIDGLDLPAGEKDKFISCVRNSIDAVIFDRSQSFAMAVQSGTMATLADGDFTSTITSILSNTKLKKILDVDWSEKIKISVRDVLASEDLSINAHMRSLSDAYTLMAFLKQTPDVQSAVEKMFSHGSLWLDTSILLPLIAETLSENGVQGRFSLMVDAANEAGLELYVTRGVIEEVERHMNRCLACVRSHAGEWIGGLPYLLERYISSGQSNTQFLRWLENFRGDARPLDDLAEFIFEEFKIKERSLEDESAASSQELRHALEQIWYERYERRREVYGTHLDAIAITKLVSHDVECYAGVTYLRSKERNSPFGYSAWWLTVDRQAFDMKNKLSPLMNESPPDSPVMSADFLVNYLAFGSVRKKISKSKESHLPLLMALGEVRYLTPEIILEAERIREEHKGLGERVVRRKVRDSLDRAKSRIGTEATQGMSFEQLIK